MNYYPCGFVHAQDANIKDCHTQCGGGTVGVGVGGHGGGVDVTVRVHIGWRESKSMDRVQVCLLEHQSRRYFESDMRTKEKLHNLLGTRHKKTDRTALSLELLILRSANQGRN